MDRNIIYKDQNFIIVNHIEDFKNERTGAQIDQVVFLAVSRGGIHLNVDGVNHDLQADEMLLCLPRQFVHDYRTTPDFQGSVILLNTGFVRDIMHSSMQSLRDFFYVHEHPVLRLNSQAKRQFAKYLSLLQFRYEHPTEKYHSDIVNAILQAMLYELMNMICMDEGPEDTRIVRQGERLFKSFMELLVGDEVRSRSVSDYAGRLCVTSKYLSAVCKQLTGKTASAWINEYVVRDVTRLLKYSDLSIKEIALKLDFPNVSFFGKYVKNQLGMPPSEYRRKHAGSR